MSQTTSQELWTAIDDYFAGLQIGADTLMDEVLRANAAAGLPQIDVAPNQGKFLMLLAMACGAGRILEIGTLGGYSTLWLARALADRGPDAKIVTLEADPKHAATARANFERAGCSTLIELRQGRAQETLPALAAEQPRPFDFVFIDADKAGYPEYLGWSLKLSRPGTIWIVDNVVRKGAVLDPKSADESVQGVRRFAELVAREPRLQATTLQTVGSKGHDGFMMVVVGK